MGVIDDFCEPYTPEWSSTMELGCCTDQGKCGTFGVTDGIGCHENAEIDKNCGEDEIVETTDCETTGIYAVSVEVDSAWGGGTTGLLSITDDGRGIIQIILKFTIETLDADNNIVAYAEPCRVKIPNFSNSMLCESYRTTFEDIMWVSDKMPKIPVTGSLSCTHPGCTMNVKPITASIGIELLDDDSLWPTAAEATTVKCAKGTGEQCYPDQDDDGRPGISVSLPTTGMDDTMSSSRACPFGYSLSATPLSANIAAIFDGVYRSDRMSLGVRVRLGLSALLTDDCRFKDSTGFADYFQSRLVGCLLKPGSRNLFSAPAGKNVPCNKNQVLFINEALPDYAILGMGESPPTNLSLRDRTPSEGPRFRLIHLADVGENVSCEDVLNSFSESDPK
jgi:hypothetical protein